MPRVTLGALDVQPRGPFHLCQVAVWILLHTVEEGLQYFVSESVYIMKPVGYVYILANCEVKFIAFYEDLCLCVIEICQNAVEYV